MIKLPWPPTVNHYYTVARGRKILSKEGRAYKDYCAQLMMVQGTEKIQADGYSVSIIARPPDRRKRDLDNILKPLLDALGTYGAISDDSLINDLRVQRFEPIKNGSVEILVSGVNE